MALALYEILRGGGLGSGGFNFDAKLRRQSIDREDLFYAHIGGLDTLARGLLAAEQMLEDAELQAALDERYRGWEGDLGRQILSGEKSLDDLSLHVLGKGLDPAPRSGRQEWLEKLVSRYL